MDKITILLQDKQTIENLAADPEVQIRIKDAILDGIGKRAAKISNVTNAIISASKKEIQREFFNETYRFELKEEWKRAIKEQARTAFNELVNEELQKGSNEIKENVRVWKADVLKKLKEYNIEKDIRDVAELVIRDKFKN